VNTLPSVSSSEVIDAETTRPRPAMSVIIPTFNRGSGIMPTIRAALDQDFDSFEVVVVDDGSTDGTAERLREIVDPRLTVVRRSNGGISAARNTGVQCAAGQFVVPLDDDDLPGRSWLRRLYETAQDCNAGFVSCGCRLVEHSSGRVVSVRKPRTLGPEFDGYTANLLAGTFAVRREIYLGAGGFAEGLACSHQTEFALRVLPLCHELPVRVVSVDEILVDIRRRTSDRIERTPAKLLAGMEYILAHHTPQLRKAPKTLGSFHSVAGVAAWRLSERSRARAHFWSAVCARPWSWRFPARLAVSCVPFVAHRVWEPGQGTARSSPG
jgi:glycosyltransferase involved in cell wall biosynthesis